MLRDLLRVVPHEPGQQVLEPVGHGRIRIEGAKRVLAVDVAKRRLLEPPDVMREAQRLGGDVRICSVECESENLFAAQHPVGQIEGVVVRTRQIGRSGDGQPAGEGFPTIRALGERQVLAVHVEDDQIGMPKAAGPLEDRGHCPALARPGAAE